MGYMSRVRQGTEVHTKSSPAVQKWLAGASTKSSQSSQVSVFYNFLFMGKEVALRNLLALYATEKHDLAATRKRLGLGENVSGTDSAPYILLDLLQEYLRNGERVDERPQQKGRVIRTRDLAASSRRNIYATVKSFF